MRKSCLDMVHALARRDPRVVYIGSDPGSGTLDAMRKELPERFFIEGISEAHVIGMSAGMAFEGYIPYVNTIATFITRRCYEQVAVDLCLHSLPVRLIGNGGGLVYAPLGPTHVAMEDIAIMRALPDMTIVCPTDAPEMNRFMEQTLDWPHPIYIRLGKGGDPVTSRAEEGFAIGKAIVKRDPGRVLIATTGVMVHHALGAAKLLAERGIACGVAHFHTVKPLDHRQVLHALAGCLRRFGREPVTDGRGDGPSWCSGRRGPRLGRPSARRRRLAIGPFRVAVGDDHHAGRRRRGFGRLGQQRTRQSGPLAPAGCPEVGEWQHDLRIVQRGSLGSGHAIGERVEQRVLVLLGGGRSRPPDPYGIEGSEDLEPVPTGVRPPIAELRRGDRGQAPPHRGLRGADVEDGLRRQPEGRQARGEGLRRRPLPVEPERVDPLDPFADTGELDRSGRQRCSQLDDEDARTRFRDRASPLARTVGHQAD